MWFLESQKVFFFSFFKYPFNMYIYNGVKMSMAKVLQVSYRWVAFQGLYFVSVISGYLPLQVARPFHLEKATAGTV